LVRQRVGLRQAVLGDDPRGGQEEVSHRLRARKKAARLQRPAAF
jgi:hypothetical protein